MDVKEKVESLVKSALKNNAAFGDNAHIVIGLSGGPDSICLFDVLCTLSAELNFGITAVHINHKIRREQADLDATFVELLCMERGVECEIFTYECETMAREARISTEEMGRKLRYDAFEKVALKKKKEKNVSEVMVATAHNLNDQAETVLMRIIRGTGIEGLSGIPYVRQMQEYKIIRPLLDVSREDIEAYCEEIGLEFRIDETNSESIYTRNKLRLKAIPMLQEINPNVITALARLAQIAKEDKDYFAKETEAVFSEAAFMEGAVLFNRDALVALHPAVRRRALKRAFEELGLVQGITALHMQAMEDIIFSGSSSCSTDLPKGYSMANSYGEIRIYKSDEFSLGHYSSEELKKNLKISIVEENEQIKELKNMSINGNKRFAVFSLKKVLEKLSLVDFPSEDKKSLEDAVFEALQVRTRRRGDYISPLGMKGSKKLQDLFTDEKVYKEQRDNIPLVCIGAEVLWAIGDDVSKSNTGFRRGRISENYKFEAMEKILMMEYNAE